MENEEVKNIKDELYKQLTHGISEIIKTDNFKNWLNTSGNFFTSYYSLNNALLIFSQNPQATYLHGYDQWTEYGRQVKAGSKAIKVWRPVKAFEKKEGEFFRNIKNSLKKQMKANPKQDIFSQNLNVYGSIKIEVNRSIPDRYSLIMNNKQKAILTDELLKRFIRDSILKKEVQAYVPSNIFDISQCMIPETLWVSKGKFKNEELILNDEGKPIVSRRGKYQIKNTQERIDKFTPVLEETKIKEIDSKKAEILFNALKNVAEKNEVSVYLVDRKEDKLLQGGADGYFSRLECEKNKTGKGFIVLPNDITNSTRLCSVFIHEIAHSNLHNTEDKSKLYNKNIRELQAEATAYSVGSKFGIETDTSSFQYLASWQKDLNFSDIKNNLQIIYDESKRIIDETEVELKELGYNLDLEKIETLSNEEIKELSQEHIQEATKLQKNVDNLRSDIFYIASTDKPEINEIISASLISISLQQKDLDKIYDLLTDFQKSSKSRSHDLLEQIESAFQRIKLNSLKIDDLSAQFMDICSNNYINKMEEFKRKPISFLKELSKTNKCLKSLSKLQLSYIAKSKYILNNYVPLLKTNPDQFAEKVYKRAMQIDKVISDSKQFVEINNCEQWFDTPIFNKGELLHPKNVEIISKHAEESLEKLNKNATEYIPYTKCSFSFFDMSSNKLVSFTDRMDIGDGYQTSFYDYLSNFKKNEELTTIMEGFDKSLKEENTSEKIYFEEMNEDKNQILDDNKLTLNEWQEKITEKQEEKTLPKKNKTHEHSHKEL